MHHDAKVRIKTCRYARECFICVCMFTATPSCNCILEQTHAVYNAAWVVNDSYVYC